MIARALTDNFLRSLDGIQKGSLRLTMPNGQIYNFQGIQDGPKADLVLHDAMVIPNMIMKGNVAFANDYRHGRWHTNDLTDLLSLAIENVQALQSYISGHTLTRMHDWLGYLLRHNSLQGSRKNIHDHYDLGNDFYTLWLDDTMTYSSALYSEGDESLEQAQIQKYDRLIDGLNGSSGSLLEIGCGWGGFTERALQRGDYKIKGLTLSQEQYDFCQKKLDGRANIVLEDYREQNTQFDNIVSIEMFEAVGEKYWNTYFDTIATCLKKDGKAMIQTITIEDGMYRDYKKGTDYIRSYIFPGGMLPSMAKFKSRAEKAGLKIEDVFYFGQDYARTLQEWLTRFDAQESAIRALGFDDQFIRIWRFYLAGCIAGFKSEQLNVAQIKLAHA